MPFITRGLSVALNPVATTSPAEASLSVIAFDDDLERALVRFEDPNQGVMVQIRELQTGKVTKSYSDDRNAEKKRLSA